MERKGGKTARLGFFMPFCLGELSSSIVMEGIFIESCFKNEFLVKEKNLSTYMSIHVHFKYICIIIVIISTYRWVQTFGTE